MAHSTSPTSAFNRYVTHAADQVGSALSAIGNVVLSASYGLRKEVPFERWFFDHGFENPIQNTPDLIKARFWAVLATGEGSFHVVVETVKYIFSKVFNPKESDTHLDILQAQWQGFTLGILAIVSPNWAKAKADNQGQSLIGGSPLNWKWGTLYTG